MRMKQWVATSASHIKQNRLLVNFLGRAGLIYLFWVLVYNTNHVVPMALNRFLTIFVAKCSVFILQIFDRGYAIGAYQIHEGLQEFSLSGGGTALLRNGKTSVGIADTCNGLELYVLYLAYIIAFPQKTKVKLLFLFAGLPLLVLINILRVVALASIYEYLPDFFLFAHHYFFTATMYIGIFLIWYWFSNFRYAQR